MIPTAIDSAPASAAIHQLSAALIAAAQKEGLVGHFKNGKKVVIANPEHKPLHQVQALLKELLKSAKDPSQPSFHLSYKEKAKAWVIHLFPFKKEASSKRLKPLTLSWKHFLAQFEKEPLNHSLKSALIKQKGGDLIEPLEYAVRHRLPLALISLLAEKGFQAEKPLLSCFILSLPEVAKDKELCFKEDLLPWLQTLSQLESINRQDEEGKSALHHCLILFPLNGFFSEIVSFLLDNSANPDLFDKEMKIARDHLLEKIGEADATKALKIFDAQIAERALGFNFDSEFQWLKNSYFQALMACQTVCEIKKLPPALDELQKAWQKVNAYYLKLVRLPQYYHYAMERSQHLNRQLELVEMLYPTQPIERPIEQLSLDEKRGMHALLLYMDCILRDMGLLPGDEAREKIREKLAFLDVDSFTDSFTSF